MTGFARLDGAALSEVIASRKRAEKELKRRTEAAAVTLDELRAINASLDVPWWQDCRDRHGWRCNGKRGHLLRVRTERARASEPAPAAAFPWEG